MAFLIMSMFVYWLQEFNVNIFLSLSGWKIDATCEGTTPWLRRAPFLREIVSRQEGSFVPWDDACWCTPVSSLQGWCYDAWWQKCRTEKEVEISEWILESIKIYLPGRSWLLSPWFSCYLVHNLPNASGMHFLELVYCGAHPTRKGGPSSTRLLAPIRVSTTR